MENNSTDLTDEQKQYRKEYDAEVTAAQDLLNEAPTKKESKESKTKIWDHIPVRPATFGKIMDRKDKTLFRSHDAFQEELIRVYDLYKEQQK